MRVNTCNCQGAKEEREKGFFEDFTEEETDINIKCQEGLSNR